MLLLAPWLPLCRNSSEHSCAEGRTNPLVWILAIICTIIAIAVVVVGIVGFIGYIVIHPRVPVISVTNAHLDLLSSKLKSQLLWLQRMGMQRLMQLSLWSHSTSATKAKGLLCLLPTLLRFLRTVQRTSTMLFNLPLYSWVLIKWPKWMKLRREMRLNLISQELRTQWRVGPLGSVKFLCHLDCKLKFRPLNGT